ncbi:NAD(P)-dependent malic enzyme [Bacillus kexueae]|uniref:NAD(P)-dependent malic enzyme n=1 Tax=Aeribacillus kexueae TaxID=2078952 RepID=UPI001FAF90EC|nr:malic enzyme-like NAD(P)-binding protein [Bacillus kexueae]
MKSLNERALELHRSLGGKLETISKQPIRSIEDLSLLYSPGVAAPCREIHENERVMYDYTMKKNTVAVVTNGSAVLGLGNIGAAASLPVMEGKALLLKEFAGLNAVPICINTDDPEKIIETVKLIHSSYGGINLEDIKAPECFYIEERLKEELPIPVFHDDQHGTAIVTIAALLNGLKLVNKSFSTIKVVINGAGAAGIAITNLLLQMNVKEIIVCDSKGAIYQNRPYGMNDCKRELAEKTNPTGQAGTLKDVIKGADVFIGVSIKGALTKEMIRNMNNDPIVFAMANPDPEIMPEEAKEAGARIIGTGRSDYPNQVNNVLAFPGIFKGALQVQATKITEEMKLSAAKAIASLIDSNDLHEDYIIPHPFDRRVVEAVANAVAEKAKASLQI